MEDKLQKWQEKFERSKTAWEEACPRSVMDHREEIYEGHQTYKAFCERDKEEGGYAGERVLYCQNIVAEHIEAQVSVDIPMPKVTPRREEDEEKARIIENLLRNEIDRMPVEELNDQAERTVPLQGGGVFVVDWDNTVRSHRIVGEAALDFLHPKQLVPQEGVYKSIDDMDYFFLIYPETKESVKAMYGVDVSDEAESDPEARGRMESVSDEMVTLIVCYYRNSRGGIGRYAWVNNTELEDLEDYQARRLRRCAVCGASEPMPGTEIADGIREPRKWREGDPCPDCGETAWEEQEEEYQEVDFGTGPIKVPYYKPNLMPAVLQKNVSVYGKLLGQSDADKIESHQDFINRLNLKIGERFLKAGSVITLPPDPTVRIDPKDGRVIRLNSPADSAYINLYDFKGNLEQEMYEVSAVYQASRQTIGLTDSYQGRSDATATSGKAKEFSAAQAAGRMQSKRTMKEAAWARIYERLFKFILAYADEPRPVIFRDSQGKTQYAQFSKWDFLEQDETGKYFWNDMFLFSCDASSALASNRERLWQETTSFYTAGAFGDPTQLETQVEYWRKMDLLHYPGAGDTLENMQERLEQQQAMEQMQMQMQAEAPSGPPDEEVEEQARQQAISDAAAQAAGQAAMREVGGHA